MNLVNGMIVDGLGHVSLDGVPAAQVGTNLQQAHAQNINVAGNANIHQGDYAFAYFILYQHITISFLKKHKVVFFRFRFHTSDRTKRSWK